jgi:DNA-binding SARP family transcriptional activator
MSPTLDIYLLSDFHLEHDGVPVTTVSTPRLQSLLTYLVLHRNAPQARHHLAFLLWPDSAEAQARTNLRNLLHHLRRALPDADRFLNANGQILQWLPDAPFRLDVADFESASAQVEQTKGQAALRKALEKAVALYRGDLLPSCYDDWILPQRERLRQTFLRTLEHLIDLLEDERRYSEAIGYAQRLLREDPLSEATYRRLMRLHALNGDRAGALRVYHTCATTLQRELDMAPSPATREAYERQLKLERTPEAPRAETVPVPPLVGRDRVWSQLREAWRTATAEGPLAVLLTGEAGIGKTRLAEELIEWANRQGVATGSARCYATEGPLAYAPVATWLRARPLPPLDDVWLTEVARLSPDLLVERSDLAEPRSLTEAWQRQRLFEALARAVLGRKQPLMLLLDDLQWCDHESLVWLHYLLRFDPRARLLIVGTLRPEEMVVNQPLASLLTALRHNEQLIEIELEPLDRTETAALAEHLADRRLEPALASLLYQETEGNPLFVVETVRAGLPSNHRGPPPGPRSPIVSLLTLLPKVQAVIAARLEKLSPPACDLVSLAATIGREFTFAVLAEASDCDEDTLVQGLDELWQRRVLREQGTDAYDFAHDKIREMAYASLSTARRRLLHRRVAQALEKTHASDPDTVSGRIAVHYEQANQPERVSIISARPRQHNECMLTKRPSAIFREPWLYCPKAQRLIRQHGR